MPQSIWRQWRPIIAFAVVVGPALIVALFGAYAVSTSLRDGLTYEGDGDCAPSIGECPPVTMSSKFLWIAVTAITLEILFAAMAVMYWPRPRHVTTAAAVLAALVATAAWSAAFSSTELPEEDSLVRAFVQLSIFFIPYLTIASVAVAIS